MSDNDNYHKEKSKQVFICSSDNMDKMEVVELDIGIMFKNVLNAEQLEPDTDTPKKEKVEADIVLDLNDVQKLNAILDKFIVDRLLGV